MHSLPRRSSRAHRRPQPHRPSAASGSMPMRCAILLARPVEGLLRRSVWLAASMLYRGDDARRLSRLMAIADDARRSADRRQRRALPRAGAPAAAGRRHLHPRACDHRDRRPPAGSQCRAASEIAAGNGAALPQSAGRRLQRRRISSSRCNFSLDELRKTEYPDETRQGFATPQDALVALAKEGARAAIRTASSRTTSAKRSTRSLPSSPSSNMRRTSSPSTTSSASRARKASSARAAARRRIPSSAIASASPRSIPRQVDLLFERFVSAERREPPDIDVDFEHERREEVIQYIYEQIRPRARRPRPPPSSAIAAAAPSARSARSSACPTTRSARSPARCGAGRWPASRRRRRGAPGSIRPIRRLQRRSWRWRRS